MPYISGRINEESCQDSYMYIFLSLSCDDVKMMMPHFRRSQKKAILRKSDLQVWNKQNSWETCNSYGKKWIHCVCQEPLNWNWYKIFVSMSHRLGDTVWHYKNMFEARLNLQIFFSATMYFPISNLGTSWCSKPISQKTVNEFYIFWIQT